MSSFLQKLENNEAILLMYLANELPAQDREEVEEMLKHDASLAAMYQKLRDAYHQFDQTMLLGDASNVLPSGYMTAHTFGKTIKERYAARAHSVDEHDYHGRRMHWVIYPVAAAALLAIGMVVWWKSASEAMSRPSPMMVDGSRGDGRFGDGGFGDGRFGGRGFGGFGGFGDGGSFGSPIPPPRFGRFGGQFPVFAQPMLDFSSIVTGQLDELSDEAIEASFDTVVIVPRHSRAQRELVVLDYLDQSWQ